MMENEERCPDCPAGGSVALDPRQGFMVCEDCGKIVQEHFISDESEWRNFADDDDPNGHDPSRVGGPVNALLGEELSTTMEGGANTALGRLNGNLNKTSHKALLDAFRQIANLSERLNIPQTTMSIGQEVFKHVAESRKLKGKPTLSIIVACLFIACKKSGKPRVIKELCSVADCRKRDAGRALLKIKKLGLHKGSGGVKDKKKKAKKEQAMNIDRFCALLSLGTVGKEVAQYVVQQIQHRQLLEGKTPQTLAGVAIYIAAFVLSMQKSLKDVCDVVHCQPGTLKTAWKLIQNRVVELVPHEHLLAAQALPEKLDSLSPPPVF